MHFSSNLIVICSGRVSLFANSLLKEMNNHLKIANGLANKSQDQAFRYFSLSCAWNDRLHQYVVLKSFIKLIVSIIFPTSARVFSHNIIHYTKLQRAYSAVKMASI